MRENAATLDERCEAQCPHLTPYYEAARARSWLLVAADFRARCTLKTGHDGRHLGKHDEEWEDENTKG